VVAARFGPLPSSALRRARRVLTDKERSHALMACALDGAPAIKHDSHEPAGQSQTDRDRVFWRAVRWQIANEVRR
jgi:hypothetical protein